MPIRATVVVVLLMSSVTSIHGAFAAPTGCSQSIDALSGSLDSVADPHVRAVLENDFRHARKEAAEGDEDECAEILAHASKVQSQAR